MLRVAERGISEKSERVWRKDIYKITLIIFASGHRSPCAVTGRCTTPSLVIALSLSMYETSEVILGYP